MQALRHFYVLAAEPRLILPRDIDNKQSCYATVHLTFKNERLAAGQEKVLKAPCLLPQLDSLEKVELNDDRYWAIVFERGYNWQQLEGMLEKCGSLCMKQRAGCLSYLEDPHGFRSLVAQTLTGNVVTWVARAGHVTSFTNDRTVLNIVKYFLNGCANEESKREMTRDGLVSSSHSKNNSGSTSKSFNDSMEKASRSHEGEKMEIGEISSPARISQRLTNVEQDMREVSEGEKHFLQILATIVYECVIRDKITLLPLWVNMYKSIETIERRPTSYVVWQIKLVSSQVLQRSHSEDANALLSIESVLAMKQRAAFIMDSWEEGKKYCLLILLIIN